MVLEQAAVSCTTEILACERLGFEHPRYGVPCTGATSTPLRGPESVELRGFETQLDPVWTP
jgi:hypothetical protein